MKTVINGIAKGSGMIAPNMATMLGFVFTDAPLSSACLHQILTQSNENSFNSITVDGDTSTNDCVIAFATGECGVEGLIDDPEDPRLAEFRIDFEHVMQDLAKQIVCDGEGARKFIEVQVSGAETDKAAKKIALSIANSPLVKTAIAGEDANWGRIVMAAGKVGEKLDKDLLKVWIGDILVAEKGAVASCYDEQHLAPYMQEQEIAIFLDLGIGGGQAKIWTCDLTHQYIDINADYRS